LIRLVVRLLFWPLALVLALLLLAPLTETGTRLVVQAADDLLPLDIRYRGGKLAGELELESLGWAGDDVNLQLQDVVLELAPGCLWRSKFCFRQLQVGQLLIELVADSQNPADQQAGPDPDLPADHEDALFVFPVELESRSLQIDNTRIHWNDGQWSQGILQGAVTISGSTINVSEAVVDDARLELRDPDQDAPAAAGQIDLPRINLPLELVVGKLLLERPAWDAYGDRRALRSLLVQGRWQRTVLQLGQLRIRSVDYGTVALAGQVDFSANWPLEVAGEAEVADLDGWPTQLERRATIEASGDLAALHLQLLLGEDTRVQLEAQVNTLDTELPFQANATAQWPGELLPSGWLTLPDTLAQLQLSSPLRMAAGGTLASQHFQLQASGSVPELPALALELAGRHEAGVLTIEDMRLQDQAATNTLWGLGQVTLGQPMQWSATLESSGFDLPGSNVVEQAAMTFKGRVEGRLQLAGSSEADAWQLSISEADLAGTINGLPALVVGYAGLDSDMKLAASDLKAELNGASLVLLSPQLGGPAQLKVDVPQLGRWHSDVSGQLALNAQVASDWQQVRLQGSLTSVVAGGAEIRSGAIKGVIRLGKGRASTLGLTLAEVTVAGLELSSLRLELNAGASGQGLLLQTVGDLQSELQFNGRFDDAGQWRGSLAPTAVVTRQGEWRLDEPVAVGWSQSPMALDLAAHCWQHLSSSLCFSQWGVGPQGGGSIELLGGMDLLSAVLPEDIQLEGVLDASLALDWTPDTPLQVNGEVHARDWRMTRYYGVGEYSSVSWDKIDAIVRRTEQGLQLTADGYREGSRKIDLDVLLPPNRQAPLNGNLAFEGLQLGVLVPFAPGLAALEGELTGALQLAGTVDRPMLDGSVNMSAGRFVMVGNSTEFNAVELQIDVNGDKADIAGSGMLGGGKLDISGQAVLRPEPQMKLSLVGSRHQLLIPPTVQMLVSENLQLSVRGESLDIRGDIQVHEGILEQDALPEGSVDISPDVVMVDYSGNVVSRAKVFNTSMDIGLLIENKFRIVGDMVDATVGGDLRLSQAAGQPLQVFGNLNVLGGELRAYQQLLRVKRGTISFAGNPKNPELDVRAQREISAERITVGVAVQGTLNEPRLDVFSDPVMPQGETMSYLVRGRGLDSGANSDGMAMALSVGTGVINQTELVSELNRIPGLSNVAFGAEGSAEDTAATVGGYIGDRLYLSYGVGVYEPINVLTARLYLKTRLWLEVVSRLENSVDIYYSFDLK